MHILLPVDGSDSSQRTLEWASGFLDPACIRVSLVHVVYWSVDALVRNDELDRAGEILRSGRRFMESRGFQVERAEHVLGSPSEAICRFADEHNVDQIIIGSHGHQGLTRILMGNVSRGVFNQARQPVLLLNNTAEPTLEVSKPFRAGLVESPGRTWNVLIPVDGSYGAQMTMEWAVQLLNPKTSRIHLLNVFDWLPESRGVRSPNHEESQAILSKARDFLNSYGFTDLVEAELMGAPAPVICDYADEHGIDQILIGSHRTRAKRWETFLMGSVTREVFETANKPVIVVKTGEHPSLKVSHPEEIPLSEGECRLDER